MIQPAYGKRGAIPNVPRQAGNIPASSQRKRDRRKHLPEGWCLEDLHGAVKDALRLGAIGFDAVKHLVLCRLEKRPPKLDLDVYPYLPKATVGRTSAASYMCLLSEDAA